MYATSAFQHFETLPPPETPAAVFGMPEKKQRLIGGYHPYARQFIRVELTYYRRTHLSYDSPNTSRFFAVSDLIASLMKRKLNGLHPGYLGMRDRRSNDHDLQDHEYAASK